jgi:CSLREA domain-containing protein
MMRVARLLLVVALIAAAPGARAATFVATTGADGVDAVPGDGVCATAASTCTLRAAIQEANALSGADSIVLPADTYTLNPSAGGEDAAASGDLDITGSLTITGPAVGRATVSGNGDRVFDIFAPAVVVLTRLTIQSGNAAGTTAGGGIRNAGDLTLSVAVVRGNVAGGDGGGLANRPGGKARLTNVTITANFSGALGGGIANDSGATLQLVNVTVSLNSALQGGGIDNIGSAQAVNTIVANSIAGSTCAGAVVTSLGHNLDSGTTCLFSEAGDQQSKDPKLGPLADAGGTTYVLPLLPGSPAIDAGDNLNCPSTDQRGQLRPADGNLDGIYNCDIGAYEVFGLVLPTATASPTGSATSTPSPPTATTTPTPTGTPPGGAINLNRVTGQPGEQVVFTAMLSTKGAAIARAQNDIAFDSVNAPITALPNEAPDCTVNPQIGKEATSFAFLPQGCSAGTCTSLHASMLSALNTTAIPDGVLYTCKVNIAPSAATGEYPLTISGVILEDPNGQPLPSPVGSSGAIMVIIPTPTHTPGAADCCQCSGPVVCGPGAEGCGSCAVVFGAACNGGTGLCVTFTPTPTNSPTASASQTSTATATSTPAPTSPNSPTATPVSTSTATATGVDLTPTQTATPTGTGSASESPTLTPTTPSTATSTESPATESPGTTATVTPTATTTSLITPSVTSTATATDTATATATVVTAETPTVTASLTTTPTATPSPSETPSASPTPTPCAGDCDDSGDVSVAEVITMANIALGTALPSTCLPGDLNGDAQITIDEILAAVGNSLAGCQLL